LSKSPDASLGEYVDAKCGDFASRSVVLEAVALVELFDDEGLLG
jgi:hypothetical protein